ncbi:MAG: DHHA1 domain-containing protein, partial [Candidatus Binatia bacterium]
TYTPRMRDAHRKVEEEMRRSFAVAEASRRVIELPGGVSVVGAVCDGYPSEIADRWGKAIPNAVFVLFDLKSGAISYRRSPDCAVDLSKLAESFGGGGHPAAAGSEMPELLTMVGAGAAERAAAVIRTLEAKR